MNPLNFTDESQIIAVIDFQGFFVNKVFYIREFAWSDSKHQLVFEVIPNIDIDTKIRYFKTFMTQTRLLHGIRLERVLNENTKRVITEEELSTLIPLLYKVTREGHGHNCFVAVKNQQAHALLRELDIPVYDLERQSVGCEMCPTLQDFDAFGYYHYCPLHRSLQSTNKNHRCSLRKACRIWEWIRGKLYSDMCYKDLQCLSILKAHNIEPAYSGDDDDESAPEIV